MYELRTKVIVPLERIEYGFGYIIIRSPYTPYSIYLSGTIGWERPIGGIGRPIREDATSLVWALESKPCATVQARTIPQPSRCFFEGHGDLAAEPGMLTELLAGMLLFTVTVLTLTIVTISLISITTNITIITIILLWLLFVEL